MTRMWRLLKASLIRKNRGLIKIIGPNNEELAIGELSDMLNKTTGKWDLLVYLYPANEVDATP
jgi:hypothetical protein